MHQLLKYFLAIYFLIGFNIYINADDLVFNINYESGMQLDSQKFFNESLSLVISKKELRLLLEEQDWIASYTIRSLPFSKKVHISISNRIPIFILNDRYYVDKDLKKFKFDFTNTSLIRINGDIKDLDNILLLIDLFSVYKETNFALISINFNHVRGWLINTDSSVIKLGKKIDSIKIKNTKDTLNYLYEKRKIPKIIDLRYKDGVALKHG
jgi:cell division septal protein FtsQ